MSLPGDAREVQIRCTTTHRMHKKMHEKQRYQTQIKGQDQTTMNDKQDGGSEVMLGVIPGNLPGTYRPMGTCRQVTKNQLQTDKHTKRITNLESFLSNSSSSSTIILTREGGLVNEAVVSAPLSHLSSHSPNVSLYFPGHCPPFPLTLSHYFCRTDR